MKKILILLLLTLPFLAQAQLETYGRYTSGGTVEPNINYFGSKKVTARLSFTFFGLVEQQWGEALAGISYAPSKLLSIGGSAGVEHGTSSPRFGASLWTGKGKVSFSILGEKGSGRDNYLYKANLFYKYSSVFTLGVTAWRLHGFGPNFRYRIPGLQTTIWVMPAYDFEADKSRLMAGVSMNM